MIEDLYQVILERKINPPQGSYTASLFTAGLPQIAQKVGEESTEVVVAALSQGNERLAEEIADLTYHLLVLMAASGVTPSDVTEALAKRRK
jgi:phosphoribosyl-ATP pyrophosphohydrolase